MEPEFFRICPIDDCNKVIVYKNADCLRSAKRNNSKCPKCAKQNISDETKKKMSDSRMGKNKGKTWDELYGVEKANEIREKQSVIRKGKPMLHHAKITELRKLNGTYKHSEESKKLISEVSIFKNRGRDHVNIKRFLEDNNITFEEYESQIGEFRCYRREVNYITKKQPIHLLENYDKPRGKAGIEGAFQLDHIISIFEGFKSQISPEIIGNISNLQFIPWLDNLRKNKFSNRISNNKES